MNASCFIFVVFLKSCFLFSSDGYILSSFHLVDGSSPNEGRVEVTVRDDHGDELRGVVVSGDSWTRDAANWVCEELGYRHAVFVPDDNRFGRGLQSEIFSIDNQTFGKVFETVKPECDSDESDSCSEIEAAGVICQKPGYLGCFRIRRLVFPQTNISETNDQCLELCRNQTAPYAAQMGDTCYCLTDFSESFPERVCNTRCSGDREQFCGGNQGDSYIVFNVSAGFCPEISGVNLNLYGRYRFGDIVRANCSGGLRLMGDDVLQCLGGPDFFEWNGTIPTCEDFTTLQPRTTNDPATELTRRTLTPARRTVTGSETRTDATRMNSVTATMGMGSGSKSTTVQVVVSVVTVVIVAVLAVFIAVYITRTRKAGSVVKQDESLSHKSNSINMIFGMKNVPDSEEPSYYEVGQHAVTERNNGVINEVLYESAEDVRTDPKQCELDQSSPKHTPHYGLIENVLYKPLEGAGDPHSNNYEVFEVGSHSRDDSSHDNPAFDEFQQFPNDDDLPSNNPEYSFSTEHERSGGHQEGELIDNVLYEPADNQTLQTGSASRNCSDITPDSVGSHYSEGDSPISDTGLRYCDIHPQPAHSQPRSNVDNHDNDAGPEHGKTDLATAEGPRFDVSTENTPSSLPEYATVNKVTASKGASDNSAAVGQTSFSCNASVHK